MPAVVRYVECKALVAGTTTSQGLEIFSNKGARRLYRGNIRKVEEPTAPQAPSTETPRTQQHESRRPVGRRNFVRHPPCKALATGLIRCRSEG
jgi:hypothetical protein